MARYKVAHDLDRTWISRKPSGEYAWDIYENAHQFDNYKQAKAALDSLPDEDRMYGVSYRQKCMFMKSYDSKDHMRREQEYLATKRLLRSWGH